MKKSISEIINGGDRVDSCPPRRSPMKINSVIGKLILGLIIPSLIGCGVSIKKIKSFGPEPSPPVAPVKSITNSTPTPPPPVQPVKNKTITIIGSNVNIRSGPGTTFEVIGTCKYGDIFEIQEDGPEWIKVRVGPNTLGWVSSKFVKKTDDLET